MTANLFDSARTATRTSPYAASWQLRMAAICFVLVGISPRVYGQEGLEFFEAKIRPVLVEQCYECHSASAAERNKLKGGLRLDTRAATLRGGESGAAIVPGHADQSLLLSALRHEDGLEMPPQGKLPDAVIDDFAQWIERGAADPRELPSAPRGDAQTADPPAATSPRTHWAFLPPRAHPRPSVTAVNWPRAELDYFVLAPLEARGLMPVGQATKRELIRRVTFDLIGLPPTREEVERFLQDDAPQAFDRLVDRLLASPHYGERWGRFWLDVARYADDKALAYHNPWPHAYRYRDWVVNALNQDVPYDRFVRLQLAGDLMPEPVTDYTMRLAALGFQGLGAFYHKGNVPEQVMADELDDRVDTLSRGLLGLTVACARCHDHKYDPISTQDYYSLAAAYNGASWSEVAMASPEAISKYETWREGKQRREDELAKWLAQQTRQIARRELASFDRYLLTAWRRHVGMESDLTTKQQPPAELKEPFLRRSAKLLAEADLKELPPPLAKWIRVARDTPAGDANANQRAPDELLGVTHELTARVAAAFREFDRRQTAAAKRDETTSEEQQQQPAPNLAAETEVLLTRLWNGKEALFSASEDEMPSLLDERQRDDHAQRREDLQRHLAAAPPAPPQAHGVVGGGAAMRIHVRGSVNQLAELAPPGFLPILTDNDSARPRAETFTRLDLADAICVAGNPLTARVIVNRVWQQHFGQGIVATASNFGMRGDPPSHPELLDTLTVRFVESGWSLKWLHREIVSSATYQLSSRCDPGDQEISINKLEELDPANRLHWRFAPRRLELESWRDAVLAVSGQLVRQLGGPAVGRAETGHTRRTIYSTISRREPDKMLVAFDFPDANVTAERRDVTTVPQQQLFVMNSEFMVDAAKELARQVATSARDDRGRIELLYQRTYCRAPTVEERTVALEFLRAAASDPRDELTGWDQLAQALLAANEFCWVD